MKNIFIILILSAVSLIACKEKGSSHQDHEVRTTEIYTCPMHPEIIRDKPGQCPVCGMDLVKKTGEEIKPAIPGINTLLKPTNEFAITSLPVTSMVRNEEPMVVESLGYISYSTDAVGIISARVSGRIEKLYIKYRFQKVNKGQRIMDIYSPELLTAQQNLLLIRSADPADVTMLSAAKQRLFQLGLTGQQVEVLLRTGNPVFSIPVYSNYSGHVHEGGLTGTSPAMNMPASTTTELNLKEGSYIQKGQRLFSVYSANNLWVLLNIYPQEQPYIRIGDRVRIEPESGLPKLINARISYIEPFFREGNKTTTARVNIHTAGGLPVGSRVKATIYAQPLAGWWLPKESVISLGEQKIVFLKTAGGFKVHKVQTGYVQKRLIQVISGLSQSDSVALNAQYLVDSESFLQVPDN